MSSINSRMLKSISLKKKINSRLESLLNIQANNPVVKATQAWRSVDDLLAPFLGKEIHSQWFAQVKPLVLKNDVLILQTNDKASAAWINTHYQDLVETILKIQNKNLSCFFIAPNEKEAKKLHF